MATKTDEKKVKKQKRMSKGWRTHLRRQKQEARKSGTDQKKPVRKPATTVEAK